MADQQQLLSGWGRTAPTVAHVVDVAASDLPEVVRAAGPRGLIGRGLGRSYGDPAQNSGGLVLAPLSSGIEVLADRDVPAVRVTAGTSIHELIRTLLPQGLFVPVTPGTRYITVGGAIAADVHGKNHHRVGSLGNHVEELTLITADGELRRVARDRDADLFRATVGGMGLTGIITDAVLRMLPVQTGAMRVDTERLPDLEALMSRMREADRTTTYSVAWIDTLASGRHLGRSVLTTGEHALVDELDGRHGRWEPPNGPRIAAPAIVPRGLVSGLSVRAFNEVWFRRAPRRRVDEIQSLGTFFHPLDGVAGWNRLYGRRGFVQYQLVVPDAAAEVMPTLLETVVRAGHPSFLSVLKRFGAQSDGMLSFPMPGWTLAMDMPVAAGLQELFSDLDRLVADHGGRLYLAKDSRMSRAMFERTYPGLARFREVQARVDPHGVFQSDLSRRLGIRAR